MMSVGKIVVVFSFVIAACAQAPLSGHDAAPWYLQEAAKKFQMRYEECKKEHNYDPDKASGLRENQLAPMERAWQACVYAAVRKYLIPASASPALYDSAIKTSRQLTDGIENGTVTRSQRQVKMKEIVDQIDAREVANAEREGKRMREDVRRTQRIINTLTRL